MESALSGIEEEFNEKWERNEIIGWEHSTSSSSRGNTDSLYCVACTFQKRILSVIPKKKKIIKHQAPNSLPNKRCLTAT